jgi:hypothetical protein
VAAAAAVVLSVSAASSKTKYILLLVLLSDTRFGGCAAAAAAAAAATAAAAPRALHYADLGGVEDVLADIQELIEYPLKHPEVSLHVLVNTLFMHWSVLLLLQGVEAQIDV